MSIVGKSCVIATLAVTTACGDNTSLPCSPESGLNAYRPPGCIAALIFAARDTSDLLPSKVETDRYFERWVKTIDAEPILTGYIPLHYRRYGSASSLTLYTTNAALIDAWTAGVETGDAELDAMFTRLEAMVTTPPRSLGTEHLVGFRVNRLFSEEYLAAALLSRSARMDAPQQWPDSDGHWIWLDASGVGTDAATAQIDFAFGWGDCFNGCIWMHNLRSIVPPDGPATVYDMGGDPLPAGWELSPNTIPLPP